ncbi:MAG: hypothetical protein ACFE89_10290 [Candidatus Hodarchaeota archaeon]
MPTKLKRIEAARELLKLFHTRKRIETIMEKHTSPSGECPFYDKTMLSHCRLDPHAAHLHDCQGRTFTEGMLCETIADLPMDRRANITFSNALEALRVAQTQDPRTLSAFLSAFTDGYWELLAEGGLDEHEDLTKSILQLEALLAEYFADRRFDLRGRIKGVVNDLTEEFRRHLEPAIKCT